MLFIQFLLQKNALLSTFVHSQARNTWPSRANLLQTVSSLPLGVGLSGSGYVDLFNNHIDIHPLEKQHCVYSGGSGNWKMQAVFSTSVLTKI